MHDKNHHWHDGTSNTVLQSDLKEAHFNRCLHCHGRAPGAFVEATLSLPRPDSSEPGAPYYTTKQQVQLGFQKHSECPLDPRVRIVQNKIGAGLSTLHRQPHNSFAGKQWHWQGYEPTTTSSTVRRSSFLSHPRLTSLLSFMSSLPALLMCGCRHCLSHRRNELVPEQGGSPVPPRHAR